MKVLCIYSQQVCETSPELHQMRTDAHHFYHRFNFIPVAINNKEKSGKKTKQILRL